MDFLRVPHVALAALLLSVSLLASAADPVQRDAAGNRLEPLQLQNADDTAAAQRYCSTDGQWCVRALPAATPDQPAVLEVAERVDGTAEPQLRHVPVTVGEDDGQDAGLQVWPYIVRLAPAAGDPRPLTAPQQVPLQDVLVGALVERRSMYSGGGASASTLQLARIRHLDEGIQIDDNVLNVAWSANKMIRACFSERDVEQRAGACHDEYSFDAELALAADGQGMPVLRYQSRATNYPARVSPQRDSLAMGRLKKKDLRSEEDAECSYARVFRFSAGRYQTDPPLPACSDYTEP